MRTTRRHREERGQLLALFAICLVAVVGMVGLILDGGGTFVQRRDQQNVADAAAMAAGYAVVNGTDASDAARAVAAANGYTDGVAKTTVTFGSRNGAYIVTITRPHVNSFARVMGFTSWDVTTTASVVAGIPNGAFGAMPLIFNEDAFKKQTNRSSGSPAGFSEPGTGTQDVPQTADTFNWTVFCTANGNACNADSKVVDNIIQSNGKPTTIYLNDNIAPLNAGAHTTLFSDLADHVDNAYPVAIVNDDGNMIGWAWFHLSGSVGGNTKQILGWFDSGINPPPLTISATGGNAKSSYGPYTVQLTN